MVILLVFAFLFQYKSLIDNANQQRLEQLAQAVSANLSMTETSVSKDAQDLLSWLKAYPYIKQFIVFDEDGTILFRYQKQNTPPANNVIEQWQQDRVTEKWIDSDSDVVRFFYPLEQPGNAIASVYLSVDKRLIEAPFKQLFYWFCAALLVLLACVVALVWFLTSHYVLPLSRLLHHVSEESDSSTVKNGTIFERLKQIFIHFKAENQTLTEQKQQLELKLSEQDKEITETISRLVQERQKATEFKSELISAISRELKTSLYRVVSNIELLKVHVTEPKADETVSLINDSTHHLLEEINQLQDYVRLSENQLTLDLEQIDLHRFLKSVVEVNHAKASQKKNTLFLNMRCGGMELMLDPSKLRQILNNLIDNAIKFTQQGDIELSVTDNTKDTHRFLTFNVIDSAVAIKDDEKDRIFEPFQQSLLNEQQQHYAGLGLGLTICAQLIELMHGEYGVETTVQGNRFWFTIPVDIVSQYDVLPEQITDEKPGRIDEKRMNFVLVAEDNEVNQSVALGMLEKLGCTVNMVANGEEAIKSCREHEYDMIFMDYHMPLMNGVMATQHLREVLQITTPIVVLTADANEQVKFDFYAAGANDILIKPIELNKLIDLVNKFLGKTIDPVPESYSDEDVNELNSILNMKVVDDISAMAGENGDQIVDQIFQVYMQHSPALIQAIKQAFIEKNSEQLFKSAHALKSSSLNIGATAIAELAREIEKLGRENNLDQIGAYIDKLDTYYFELTSLLNGQWRGI